MSDEETGPRLLRLLAERAGSYGIAPARPERLARLALFLAELARWRRAADLVGHLSEEDLVAHALESALGARFAAEGERLLDIGSGAGFPGIPLAIWGLEVTLLEPRQKRAAFLRHVLRKVPGLNARVRVARVEHLSGPPFDLAAARAVGSLGDLIGEGTFLKDSGRLLVWIAGEGEPVRGLSPGVFRPIGEIPIPGSRSRRIVAFEKCSTGNTGAGN